MSHFRKILFGTIIFSLFAGSCAGTPEPEPAPPVEEDVWSLIDRGEIERAREKFLGEVNVGARDGRERTPLHAAAEKKSPELASFFLSLGAKIDAEDSLRRTPLDISSENLDGATARVLVEGGSNIHRSVNGRPSPALAAIRANTAFLEAILTAGSVQAVDDEGRTILHLAALEGNAPAVSAILNAGALINKRDKAGKTPLDLAFTDTQTKNYAETAEKLILEGGISNAPIYEYFAPAVRSSNYDIRMADGIASLHYAAQEGHTGYVRFLLDKRADINVKNASGTTPLHEAARAGNIEIMSILIDGGADVNLQDAKGNSVLHLAVPTEVHREALNMLLSHGAVPNLRDEHGDSPLHIVITLNRSTAILQTLLLAGADVTIHNVEGKTPLYVAVQGNRASYIPLLLQYKSDIFAVDTEGITPFERALRDRRSALTALITEETVLQNDSTGNTILQLATLNRADPQIIALILDKQALVNARNKEGDTSLHIAVRLNSAENGGLLLSRGADIFAPNARGETPIYLTFFPGKDYPPGVREWMLASGTTEARDGLGNTILHYAAQWRLDTHIPLIVQKGALTDAANATGETPLFVAVKADSASTIQALINAGASTAYRDTLGNTVLHAAVRWNAPHSAEALIGAGVDINTHAMNGKTPLHDSVRLGITSVETLLIRYGADPDVRDNEGNTPLMEGVMMGYTPVIDRLTDAGADPSVRNSRGDTPLHIAVTMDRIDVVNQLLSFGCSIHAKNSLGTTPFRIALNTSPRMVSTLLTKDRIYVADDDGRSPLHIALRDEAAPSIIQTIIDQGGRVSGTDAEGHTPLRVAADMNNWEAARLLAEAGADPFAAGGDGKTPAAVVLAKGREPVRAVFSGRSIIAKDKAGNTILHYAAQYGSAELIALLLDLGANKNTRNIADETPAQVARRWNRPEISALLNS
ncbi:MAG: ankyrin repeat domain-containing protein [Treponema sp.]|jgi:ankyrin repeat protein|nr:ankyrin repeat domain-containing protein [Treponema sp.]